MVTNEELTLWIDAYFDARVQQRRPEKDIWGKHILAPYQVNYLLRAALAERNEASKKLL